MKTFVCIIGNRAQVFYKRNQNIDTELFLYCDRGTLNCLGPSKRDTVNLVSLRLHLVSRCQEQSLRSKLVRRCAAIINYHFQGHEGPKQCPCCARDTATQTFMTLKQQLPPRQHLTIHLLRQNPFTPTRILLLSTYLQNKTKQQNWVNDMSDVYIILVA